MVRSIRHDPRALMGAQGLSLEKFRRRVFHRETAHIAAQYCVLRLNAKHWRRVRDRGGGEFGRVESLAGPTDCAIIQQARPDAEETHVQIRVSHLRKWLL